MKKTFLFLYLGFIAICNLHSQTISNLIVRQDQKNLIITYDIVTAQAGQTFDVTAWYSENGGAAWKQITATAAGSAVGSGITAGNGKKITWLVLNQLTQLVSNQIVFEIRATVNNPIPNNFVLIQGGTFQMGDGTTHSVTLSTFYMSKYEVTQAEWKAVMGSNPSYFGGCDNCPVESVSWNDIQTFIQKLNAQTGQTYRLPTEAEWEYAAGGGNGNTGNGRTKWAGTNNESDLGTYAWFSSNSGSKTHPVGEKQPNSLGLYDMSGNVWEWCSDIYGTYPSGSQTNPTGAATGSRRVLRGGSWDYYASSCRVAYRYYITPSYRYYDDGFRLVCAC